MSRLALHPHPLPARPPSQDTSPDVVYALLPPGPGPASVTAATCGSSYDTVLLVGVGSMEQQVRVASRGGAGPCVLRAEYALSAWLRARDCVKLIVQCTTVNTGGRGLHAATCSHAWCSGRSQTRLAQPMYLSSRVSVDTTHAQPALSKHSTSSHRIRYTRTCIPVNDMQDTLVNDDDRVTCAPTSGNSRLDADLPPGVLSYIVVSGYNGDAGDYVLSVWCRSGCGGEAGWNGSGSTSGSTGGGSGAAV